MTEDREAGLAESVHQARRQRRLGADHRQVDLVLQGKGLKPLDISIFQRDVERLKADAGIARGTIDLRDLRTAAQRIHDSVFPTAASNHKDGLSKAFFQMDLLALDGGLLGGKRINKAHKTNV